MRKDDEKYLEKAAVLVEALPYIQKFNRKVIVVKYGGSAMVDEQLKKSVISDVTLLKLVGFKPIIVHGGGKEISKWVGKVGKEAQFINGLRVTDEETMEIAEMVLGRVNKSLVSMVEELGVKAVGISGKDGGLLKVKKKYADGKDIGYVGEITDVDPKILYDLMEKDFLPIICPVGLDDEFNTYNINADDAACAIARAVGANKLAFLTDIEGLYRDFEDKSSLISEITVKEAKELIAGGTIGGGMLPKLSNCIDAIEAGVSRVHIIDGRIPHSILMEIFSDRMGKISRLVVKKLSGFEMNILATDPYVKQADVEGLGITMATPEELYAKSDFVIVHTSLFPSTFHLVGAEQFKAMKNTAFIINAARGAVIDEAAMIEALKSGEIAGAGLDVFEQEPPADDNPLFSMENVIVSPHNAALSNGALRAMAMDSAQGITEYLTGKPVTYPVNKEVLK